MPEYICVDETYLAKLEVLTSNLEKLEAEYTLCVSKQDNSKSANFQINELEYEISKAELALASLRIDNVANNKISF